MKQAKIAEKLIDSHIKTRNHLFRLYEGVTQSNWELLPEKSIWSMQNIAAELINYERKLMNKKLSTQISLVSDQISLEDFSSELEKNSEIMIDELSNEVKKHGFLWKRGDNDPSFHFIFERTIQHMIYHLGGVSVLRHMIGLSRSKYDLWEKMIDTIFLAGLPDEYLK